MILAIWITFIGFFILLLYFLLKSLFNGIVLTFIESYQCNLYNYVLK